MFETSYEALTPYESGMLRAENPTAFNRIYENMRHTLRRRKNTLEKYGRTDTAGYERLVEALETTRGNKSAENFSILSNALNSKMTKYTEQLKAERRFAKGIQQKYGVKLSGSEMREVMRRMHVAMGTKEGKIKYTKKGDDFWDTAIQSVKKGLSVEKFMSLLGK